VYLKLFIAKGPEINVSNFNFSYPNFGNNTVMFLLVNFFYLLIFLFFSSLLFPKISKQQKDFFNNSVGGFFNSLDMLFFSVISYIFMVIFYSFYSFAGVFRFIVPLTPLLLIALVLVLKSFSSLISIKMSLNIRKYSIISLLFVLLLSVGFVSIDSYEYLNYEKYVCKDCGDLLRFITPEYVYGDLNISSNSILLFKAGYLGEIIGLNNYLDSYYRAQYFLGQNREMYYVDSPFETIDNSFISESTNLDFELVGTCENCFNSDLSIYRILVLNNSPNRDN
jgi:hypothetical protein